ncbi:MAG: putative amylopullulanase [Ferruginibacter sp.]|nr:putative amylopullulanase [Ferruginibacter sp.]
MKKKFTYYLAAVVFSTTLLFFQTGMVAAQTNVVVPGSFQSELGCPGDWMPDCDNTALVFNAGTGLWEGTFNIPAGFWEYKVAIDHSWAINYGAGGVPDGPNIFLNLPVMAAVTFTYDPVTHFITSSVPPTPTVISYVVLPGTFQSELGCPGDWDPACDNTGLLHDPSTNLWLGTFHIDAGYWEYKVAINHAWTENYGAGGIQDGANIPLFLTKAVDVKFSYDPITHLVSTTYGCTHGMGYWKTHSQAGPAARNDTWNYVGEYSPFFWSGKTWNEIMRTPPGGNVYYILAHQYVAATLNRYIASSTPAVDQALSDVANFFFWYTPSSRIDKAYRTTLLNVATILENYNEGATGPGTCDDKTFTKQGRNAADVISVSTAVIKVWPNPANTYFTLRTGTPNATAQVRVLDVTGRQVYGVFATNGKDLQFGEKLPRGIYFSEVIQGGKRTTIKLVKQ